MNDVEIKMFAAIDDSRADGGNFAEAARFDVGNYYLFYDSMTLTILMMFLCSYASFTIASVVFRVNITLEV